MIQVRFSQGQFSCQYVVHRNFLDFFEAEVNQRAEREFPKARAGWNRGMCLVRLRSNSSSQWTSCRRVYGGDLETFYTFLWFGPQKQACFLNCLLWPEQDLFARHTHTQPCEIRMERIKLFGTVNMLAAEPSWPHPCIRPCATGSCRKRNGTCWCHRLSQDSVQSAMRAVMFIHTTGR